MNKDTLTPRQMSFLIDRGFEYDKALTLQDVVDLMPKFIIDGDDDYFPTIAIDNNGYVFMYCTDGMKKIIKQSSSNNSIIDAAYNVLLWCISKNFIIKGEKK